MALEVAWQRCPVEGRWPATRFAGLGMPRSLACTGQRAGSARLPSRWVMSREQPTSSEFGPAVPSLSAGGDLDTARASSQPPGWH